HHVSMQGHAIDGSALQSAHGDVIDESEAAAGLNLEGPNGIGIGEACVEILTVHGEANAVRKTAVGGRSESVAAHLKGRNIDPCNISAGGVGGVNAILACTLEKAEPVGPKKASPDA